MSTSCVIDRDYAENILQEDLTGLLRPGYRPGMYPFQEYCRGRDKNLLQVIEENIRG